MPAMLLLKKENFKKVAKCFLKEEGNLSSLALTMPPANPLQQILEQYIGGTNL